MLARPGSNRGERFGTAAQRDGDAVGEIRPIGQFRFEQRLHVPAHLLGVLRLDDSGNIQRAHQTHGANWNLCVLLDGVIVQDVDFEAAAAEIDDAARRRFRTHHGDGGFAPESRFFGASDDFEQNSGFAFDLAGKCLTIARLTRGAGRDGAIACDAVLVHHFLEVTECLYAFFENIFGETVAEKNAFAEAQRIALAVERFDIEGGIGAGDGKAHCVGAGIDRRDVNWLRHASEFNARGAAMRMTERILWRECRAVRRCAGATAC